MYKAVAKKQFTHFISSDQGCCSLLVYTTYIKLRTTILYYSTVHDGKVEIGNNRGLGSSWMNLMRWGLFVKILPGLFWR